MNRQIRYPILSLVVIFLWVMGACTSNTKALISAPLPTSPLELGGKYASGEVYTITGTNGGDTVGVFRPSQGTFYLKNRNTTGFADIAFNYGLADDYPLMGDWNGDGVDTIGVYRDGSFLLRNSNTIGFADIVFAFGAPGDQPVAGDWDGDGVDTIGVYRSGNFLLRNSNTGGAPDVNFVLGNPGDIGIAGDWNGDGVATTGVFRPSDGALYLKNTNATGFADIQVNYGLPGDKPVTGDWNNDGTDTIGVYRNGTFYLRNSNTIGFADIVFAFGTPGDMPIGNSGAIAWSDEFNDASLDTSKWNTVDNGWDPANNSWMTPANVSVSDGNLVLTSDIEAASNPADRPYTSAGVFTGLKYSFQYGRLEIRAKVPTGKGMWPIIWLLPPDPNMFITGIPAGVYGTWPLSGEIDILECLGTAPNVAQVNLHYGNPHVSNSVSYVLPAGGVVSDWHTYAVDWQPHVIRWYVDGVLVKTESDWFTSAPGAAFPAPFDQPMSVIINVVVGGEWQGEPDENTVFPNQMLIDWVRVYQ